MEAININGLMVEIYPSLSKASSYVTVLAFSTLIPQPPSLKTETMRVTTKRRRRLAGHLDCARRPLVHSGHHEPVVERSREDPTLRANYGTYGG